MEQRQLPVGTALSQDALVLPVAGVWIAHFRSIQAHPCFPVPHMWGDFFYRRAGHDKGSVIIIRQIVRLRMRVCVFVH